MIAVPRGAALPIMLITVKVKQPGRKRALIDNLTIEIDDLGPNPTLGEFLDAVVAQQVREFNLRASGAALLPFLSNEQIDAGALDGKIGFGASYNDRAADVTEARQNARQAFDDGLFAVFIGDDEIRALEQTLALKETSIITFVRLTFLAGSIW